LKKIYIIIFCLVLLVPLSGCTDQSQTSGLPDESPPDEQPVDTPPPETTTPPPPPTEEPPDTYSSWGIFPYAFTGEDIYGNTVTETTLGEKQLFFIHLWATWCPPCVVEMPEFAAIIEEFGDSVGFIALLDDYDDNLEGARKIADNAGVPQSFIMVDANLSELRDLSALLHTGYVPTTILIKANGTASEPLVGAYGDGYATIIESILNDINQ